MLEEGLKLLEAVVGSVDGTSPRIPETDVLHQEIRSRWQLDDRLASQGLK